MIWFIAGVVVGVAASAVVAARVDRLLVATVRAQRYLEGAREAALTELEFQ